MNADIKVIGSGNASRSRFVAGTAQRLSEILKASRMKPIQMDIVIVQPGVQRSNLTDSQAIVLGSAATYIRQTIDVDLTVICSD